MTYPEKPSVQAAKAPGRRRFLGRLAAVSVSGQVLLQTGNVLSLIHI